MWRITFNSDQCFRDSQSSRERKSSASGGKYCTGRSKSWDLQHVLGALNSFAGGVFLATCLLDLLPEAREAIDENEIEVEFFKDYPLAELGVIFGVVLLLITELCIERCTQKFLDRQDECATLAYDPCHCIATQNEGVDRLEPTDEIGVESTPESPLMKPLNDDDEPSNHPDKRPSISFRMLALVIALSFHSIFDGLAIGLQSNLQSLLEVFVAISVHKSVFAFSLGIRLSETRKCTDDPVYLYLFGFAAATPIGITVGILIEHLATGLPGGHIIVGILQSLATGTLMYVTFFEILPEELRFKGSLLRFLSLFFGVGIIAFLIGYFAE
ncbi:putative zinc transporter ZIP1-like [Apostichopus japonicus]|uniref:Putative zinc transporter ZIP1-like n=1 Tax=Stichopus japonicus TaxID=307972 RepID=A0A2G8JDS1_STIJA|nr:putative zinc transporter ZIP1-like [Apostichopus japonicus]